MMEEFSIYIVVPTQIHIFVKIQNCVVNNVGFVFFVCKLYLNKSAF
jgi:hypothetical protein